MKSSAGISGQFDEFESITGPGSTAHDRTGFKDVVLGRNRELQKRKLANVPTRVEDARHPSFADVQGATAYGFRRRSGEHANFGIENVAWMASCWALPRSPVIHFVRSLARIATPWNF
jgi:hypothetical protein